MHSTNLALRRKDDQVLGWKLQGDSAELVTTEPTFDPHTPQLILEALEPSRGFHYVSCSVADRFTQPFVELVIQRPLKFDGIKCLCEAGAWEVCILMTVWAVQWAVTDVVGRSQWLHEYLEDVRLDSRARPGSATGHQARPRPHPNPDFPRPEPPTSPLHHTAVFTNTAKAHNERGTTPLKKRK